MGIEFKGGVIHYYGNPAGYVKDGKAVADPMFAGPELSGWLARKGFETEWRNGVYDRLSSGAAAWPGEEAALKSCRIWQLKDSADVMMKFISLAEIRERFGEPDPENYRLAYDGQVVTNDLEQIWEIFNTRRPSGFDGHSLSMSDVVELYDHTGGDFYYVDRLGFQPIDFNGGSEQIQGFHMGMGM
jgi:hypothetical protein